MQSNIRHIPIFIPHVKNRSEPQKPERRTHIIHSIYPQTPSSVLFPDHHVVGRRFFRLLFFRRPPGLPPHRAQAPIELVRVRHPRLLLRPREIEVRVLPPRRTVVRASRRALVRRGHRRGVDFRRPRAELAPEPEAQAFGRGGVDRVPVEIRCRRRDPGGGGGGGGRVRRFDKSREASEALLRRGLQIAILGRSSICLPSEVGIGSGRPTTSFSRRVTVGWRGGECAKPISDYS